MANPREDWTRMDAEGPERVTGIGGIDIELSVKILRLIENLLDYVAKRPVFKDVSSDEIADAVLKGLNVSITKEAIIKYLDQQRSQQ